jgi:uncharacterized protein
MAGSQSPFVWYELMSTDVAAAKVFYSKVVGWSTQDMPMPDMTYTVLQAGDIGIGGMMPLAPSARQAGMKPCWVGYIHADDVDAAASKLEQLGGKIHRPPTDIPTVGRFAAVADPQGAAFHLFKPGQPAQPRKHPPANAAGQIGWHELHTTAWPQAFDFYHAMFGWLKGDSVDMGAMGTYQLFTLDVAIGGMMNSPAAAAQCFWLYYFNVGDIDAAGERISAGGGKVQHGPQQVPGGSWIIQATDPQGAWFAVVGSREKT